MILATSLGSFGNLNKASTTYSYNPPKKMHFGCGIFLGIEIMHIGLERPGVLHFYTFIPTCNSRYSKVSLSLISSLK
jgi:hypothetical protein